MKTEMPKFNKLLVIAIIVITISSVGVCAQQYYNHKASETILNNKIQVLSREAELLKKRNEQDINKLKLNSGESNGGIKLYSVPLDLDDTQGYEDRYVKLISPNGGEKLCLQENFEIRFEAVGVKVVSFSLKKYSSGGASNFYFGSALINYEKGGVGNGSYNWKVGKLDDYRYGSIRESYSYKMQVMSSDGGLSVYDTSDDLLAILECDKAENTPPPGVQ
ncbi:MAG: hypothetical protein ABIG90_02595 [bacterium]